MTLSPGQKVAVAALVLVDGGLLLFVAAGVVSIRQYVEPTGLLAFLLLIGALTVPLVILAQSRGRRALLAWGVFLATLAFAFGTCMVLLWQSGVL